MTNKINIYINYTNKKNLELKYMVKYHVSLSTLAEKLTIAIIQNSPTNKENYFSILCDDYLMEEHKKTCIKPKSIEYVNIKNPSKFYSNILYLLAKGELNKISNDPTKIKQRLGQELAKVRDNYWNLNAIIRTQKRARRILEKYE